MRTDGAGRVVRIGGVEYGGPGAVTWIWQPATSSWQRTVLPGVSTEVRHRAISDNGIIGGTASSGASSAPPSGCLTALAATPSQFSPPPMAPSTASVRTDRYSSVSRRVLPRHFPLTGVHCPATSGAPRLRWTEVAPSSKTLRTQVGSAFRDWTDTSLVGSSCQRPINRQSIGVDLDIPLCRE